MFVIEICRWCGQQLDAGLCVGCSLMEVWCHCERKEEDDGQDNAAWSGWAR